MMKKLIAYSAVVLALAAGTVSAEMQVASPEGMWALPKNKLTVDIKVCNGDRLCGTIAKIRKPLDKYGKPKLDKENPDPALRSRPIIGLPIMTDMKRVGDDEWEGKIYNADDGTTYRAEARLEGDRFFVKGCWAVFCKKLNFRRVKVVAKN
jgi:uncharacterized protein (DUF2147 family)